MGESKEKKKKVQTPLLKAYLATVPGNPPHVPVWPVWTGWFTFIALAAALGGTTKMGCLAFIAAAIVGYGVSQILLSLFPARTDDERVDATHFAAIRKLKGGLEENELHNRLPPQIMEALERAVAAYNMATTRLHVEDPTTAVTQGRPLQQALHSCFVAAVSVHRSDKHSRKDWDAVLGNEALIGEIVDTIDRQASRMRDTLGSNTERLAALRELEAFDVGEQVRNYE